MRTPSNVDELRARIDSGEARDKVPAIDPAMAPLGTDAEAGGKAPMRDELALEARSLHRPRPRSGGLPLGLSFYLCALLLFAAGAATIVLLT